MKIRLKKDDRYDIARRNEVGRRNTTEVSGDNRYTEETRRILEKLGRLATAVANHFGWDPEIVMRDFVKDLAIINNPALIAELDTNNPVDQMTDQLMRMYLADDEAFNIFRNTALAQIMNMSEERAIQTLEQILGRGQIGTSRTNQFIGNRNARRIGHNDSNFEETWNYEGWYIPDIIDELEFEFEMIENGEANRDKFKTAGDLKQWIKEQYPLNNATKVDGYDSAVSFVLRHFNQRVMNEFGGYTNYPISDSQSQEIAREYQRLSEKYDLDFEDLVYGEDGFMNNCYPDGFPDFNGDVIFSEKYWNEFEKWLKETKGIELEHDNSDFLADSKEDKQRFIAKFGEDAFNRYNRISQKLQGQYKDMTWLTANVEANELNEIFNNAEFKGYEPTDENEDFVMFKIEDLDMCQKLSEGANWCIATPTAYNTYAGYGAEYKFYFNKKTGEKYCVASVSGMNEIVDQNDNELAKLPDGVPGEVYTSAVVHEDKTSSEATLETALKHIELLSVAQLRTAYNDLFGEELSLLEDDEVKSWLTSKLPEVDTNELKRYIEQHLDAFAVLPEVREEIEEENSDEDDFNEEDVVTDSTEENSEFEKEIREKLSQFDNVNINDIVGDEEEYQVDLTIKLNINDLDTSKAITDYSIHKDFDEEGEYTVIESIDFDTKYILDYITDKFGFNDMIIDGYNYYKDYNFDIADVYQDEEFGIKETFSKGSRDMPDETDVEYSGQIVVELELNFSR